MPRKGREGMGVKSFLVFCHREQIKCICRTVQKHSTILHLELVWFIYEFCGFNVCLLPRLHTESIPDFNWLLSSVQSLSRVQLFATPWTTACQASLSITNSWSLPKPISTESVMPSNHLVLCHPLLLLPSIFPSIRVFSNESALHIRWPNYWSFSFNISPTNEHPGLISFRIHWLGLLAVQGTLKSLLQHYSWKHQFFGAQLSL